MVRDVRGLAGAWAEHQRHDFPTPSPDLAPYVERYWVVSWRYDQPYRQLVVPYPNVHLTFRAGAASVQGARGGHQVKVLRGEGRVFGVAFRPGVFRAFLGAPVRTITDRVLDAERVFGPELPRDPGVAEVEGFLRARLPAPDPAAGQAVEAVARIAAHPALTRVEALARELGVGVRHLQRLFAEHVGLSPKRVIRRYRLREVTRRLERGERVAWAALAAELGYVDQSHLVRDFRKVFGEPPAWYAGRY
ncbi:helix-turn-helix domain-containing protein [Saccharothrix coeruleofusca]|uniref:AraC family transcriptional regulator n=1 Tax=Saccharothrix coeruleofusca TaxID=33919 RepID=A0A918AQZ6_9PSEU|nr:helix-turn-helix domain-containing protein [Saccharothrix coeruleofusca]MBP2335116.1 AraC-like DNA-binding protein [Saccharothrix coeruleofusca]GGP70964.1 AraC family transcriptional regulator [Saccharothrix coeruleofusca]